jgi:hypothetical protein
MQDWAAMKIDIDLRFSSQMRAHARMLQFRIGDRVSFQAEGDGNVIGILTRYNRKTVTVVTGTGRRWNVSPSLLRAADGSVASEDQGPNGASISSRFTQGN